MKCHSSPIPKGGGRWREINVYPSDRSLASDKDFVKKSPGFVKKSLEIFAYNKLGEY